VVNVTNENDVAVRLALVFPLRRHDDTLLCGLPTGLPYLKATEQTMDVAPPASSLVVQHDSEAVNLDVVPSVVVNGDRPLAVPVR